MYNMSGAWCILIVLAIVYTSVLQVECLLCVQCWSTIEPKCEDGHILPQNCSKHEDKYCIKYEGTIRKGRVVFRGCSSEDLKSQCSFKEIENEMVHVCSSTCDADGCNVASWLTSSVLVRLVEVFFLLVVLL